MIFTIDRDIQKLDEAITNVYNVFFADNETVTIDAVIENDSTAAMNDIAGLLNAIAPEAGEAAEEETSTVTIENTDIEAIDAVGILYNGALENIEILFGEVITIFQDQHNAADTENLNFDINLGDVFNTVFSGQFIANIINSLEDFAESLETDSIYASAQNDVLANMLSNINTAVTESDFAVNTTAENTEFNPAIIEGNDNEQNIALNDTDDNIRGYNDNDTLYGYGGNDMIKGGNGDDFISGGSGSDIMFGNNGADVFSWAAGDIAPAYLDTLKDFSVAEGDRIDISDVLNFGNDGDDLIADFVRFTATDKPQNAVLEVRENGEGAWTSVTEIIKGAQLNDVQALIDNGTLVV